MDSNNFGYKKLVCLLQSDWLCWSDPQVLQWLVIWCLSLLLVDGCEIPTNIEILMIFIAFLWYWYTLEFPKQTGELLDVSWYNPSFLKTVEVTSFCTWTLNLYWEEGFRISCNHQWCLKCFARFIRRKHHR